LPGIDEPFEITLAREIDHANAQHKVLTSKVEIRLPKLQGTQWKKLEGEFTDEGKPIPKGKHVNNVGYVKRLGAFY